MTKNLTWPVTRVLGSFLCDVFWFTCNLICVVRCLPRIFRTILVIKKVSPAGPERCSTFTVRVATLRRSSVASLRQMQPPARIALPAYFHNESSARGQLYECRKAWTPRDIASMLARRPEYNVHERSTFTRIEGIHFGTEVQEAIPKCIVSDDSNG